MKRKKLIFALVISVSLSLAIISISYGYWTDRMSISGEGSFEYRLPILNDIPAPKGDEDDEIEEGVPERKDDEASSGYDEIMTGDNVEMSTEDNVEISVEDHGSEL